MAIQGILKGFANPSNHQENIILVGRGDRYEMIINGKRNGADWLELDEAFSIFKLEMGATRNDWVQVTQLETNSVGESLVTQVLELSTYDKFVSA